MRACIGSVRGSYKQIDMFGGTRLADRFCLYRARGAASAYSRPPSPRLNAFLGKSSQQAASSLQQEAFNFDALSVLDDCKTSVRAEFYPLSTLSFFLSFCATRKGA